MIFPMALNAELIRSTSRASAGFVSYPRGLSTRNLLFHWMVIALIAIGIPGDLKAGAGFPQDSYTSQSIAQLLAEAEKLLNTSATEAAICAEQALGLARRNQDAAAEAQALILRGNCHLLLYKLPEAEAEYRQALKIARSKNLHRLVIESLYRLGKLLTASNRYEQAADSYLEAVRLAEQTGNRTWAAVIEDRLAMVHFITKNQEKALELSLRARTVLQDAGDLTNRADNLDHLGIIYSGRQDWAAALDHFQKALQIREALESKYALAGTLSNVGLALNRLGRSREALELLFEGLNISTSVQDFLASSSLHSRIAPILQGLGRNREALAHFEEALRIHKQLGNKRSVMADLLALSQFYQQVMGDSAKALAYHQEYSALNRELFSEETAANIAELQTKYEADKRQREIGILQRDMANQEMARNTAIAAVLLLILFLGLTYYRYRQAARTTRELTLALQQVKTLQGLLPICANCKKIRDDTGYWHQVESYVTEHSNAEFTHGICPACAQILYPDFVQTAEPSTATSEAEIPERHT